MKFFWTNRVSVIFLMVVFLVLTGCSGSKGSSVDTSSQSNSSDSKKKLDYPKNPIELIIPWAAGGGSDAMARTLAQLTAPSLGQAVVAVNRDGANGTIATQQIAGTKGDGYKVIVDASGVFTLTPHLKKVGYSIDDFKGVVGITSEPILLAVSADSPYHTLKDLLKENSSGKIIKYGHSGANSFPDIAQATFFKEAGIKAEGVPFNGSSPAVTALLGGHIDIVAAHPFDLVPQAEAGKIRILGIFSPERSKSFPDIPTMKEQGYDIDMSVWKFLLVQKDTPDDIVKVLEEKFTEAIQSNDFQKFSKTSNLDIQLLSGKEVIERLKTESEQNKKTVKELGLK